MSLSVSFQLLKSFHPKTSEYAKADLAALTEFVLKSQKVRGEVELTLEFTTPSRIQALDRRFRGVDRNTDVIAFRYEASPHPTPLPKGEGGPKERVRGGFTGDIAINVLQARIQAKKMRHAPKREIRLLLIHGILHLLGYTDYTPVPRRRMFKRQNTLLRRWEHRA